MTTHFLPASILGVTLLLAARPTHAETITLKPVADTSLFSNAPDNNSGGNLSLAAGGAGINAGGAPLRALLRFDPAEAIPPGARITSASLQLQVVRAPFGPTPTTFDLHRMVARWTEGSSGSGGGTGTGGPAAVGETTWNSRAHGSLLWSAPGGASGADYSVVASSSADTASTEPLSFTSTPELVADVQGWIDTPAANFGWMIKDRSEGVVNTARRLASREDTTRAPALTIEFELVEPLSVRAALDDSGNICFRFTAKPGKTYKLGRREFVDTGEWTTIATQSPSDTGGASTLCDALNVNATSRFYRVSEE